MNSASDGSWSDVADVSPDDDGAHQTTGGSPRAGSSPLRVATAGDSTRVGASEDDSHHHHDDDDDSLDEALISPRREAQRMQEDWQDNLAYQENILHAHRTAPEVEGRWEDRCLKLMVVGESGQGKTTFIQNMFMAYVGEQDVQAAADGSVTSMADFMADPTRLCTRFQVANDDERVRYHFSVQDTPGYGDDLNITNNIGIIVDYVERCNAEFYTAEMEHGRQRSEPHDCRVDVCLYFIAAHRLKPVDVQFIAALAPHVALIPVIAKADCMTTEEIAAYREEVVRRLARPEVDGVSGPIPIFAFSQTAKEAAGVRHAVPPFAVVASNTTDPTVGPYWPVRRYNWGTCEAFRSRDSDFACLKRLVLELSYWDIRDSTEKRYKAYRRQRRETEAMAQGRHNSAEATSVGAKAIWHRYAISAKAALEACRARARLVADGNGAPAAQPSPLALLPLLATFIVLLFMLFGPVRHAPPEDDALHLLAVIREREHYIAQLQGETSFLLDALTGDITAGVLPAGCAEFVSAEAPAALTKLRTTTNQFVYGDVCYDEEFNAGVPWVVQLLVSGCVVFTAWNVSRQPSLDALSPPAARLVARASSYAAGFLCLFYLQRAFSRAP